MAFQDFIYDAGSGDSFYDSNGMGNGLPDWKQMKINFISPSTLKISAQGIGLVLVIIAYFLKWGILSRLGIVPEDICSPQTMTKYLKQGGDPNAWRNDFDY
ncbi:MAG: hypothetical protein AAF652_18550 [Cyanobacteria bacterium P01_C01_bin.72]